MKKLLIAIFIVVISSKVMTAQREGKASDETQVNATYVIPLTFSLTIAGIDFGDVFINSTVTDETVTANVEGEPDETFNYTISSNGVYATLDGNADVTIEGNSIFLPDGTATFNFDVGLDTGNISADFDTETVTVSIVYDSIEGSNNS